MAIQFVAYQVCRHQVVVAGITNQNVQKSNVTEITLISHQ